MFLLKRNKIENMIIEYITGRSVLMRQYVFAQVLITTFLKILFLQSLLLSSMFLLNNVSIKEE